MSIAYKIIIVSAVLSAVFFGTSFAYTLVSVRADLLEASLVELENNVAFEKEKIEFSIEEVKRTILALNETPPIQGIIRAEESGGFDEEENSTYDQWRDRLSAIFTAEMNASGVYDQLRYIDDDGNELVRVDFVNSSVIQIKEEDLQNKSGRSYFEGTNKLKEGEIFVSFAELNKEGNPPVISVPHKPVIRYATPVFNDETGERKGMIIANVFIEKIIRETLHSHREEGALFYIVGSDGSFISHPDEEKEWGGVLDLNNGNSVTREFQGIHLEDFTEAADTIFIGDTAFVYAKVNPDIAKVSRQWLILETIPKASVFKGINTIVLNSAAIGFVTFMILFFVFLFIIKELLEPLSVLSEASEKIGKGDFSQRINIKSNDEIGILANSFNQMSSELKDLYGSLENQVAMKTKDLTTKIKELEEAKSAVLNLLKDVEQSKINEEKEKNKINTIIQSIGDGVFVIDKDLKIQLINGVSEKLSGFTNEEAKGKLYSEVFHFIYESDRSVNNIFIKKVLETGKVQSMINHTLLVNKDGREIPVADSAAPLKDEQGNIIGCVVVFRDVTKEQEVDRMKNEFISIASHQLRTPLTGIRWVVERFMKKADEFSEEDQEYLKNIHVSSLGLTQIIDQLLNVSRIEGGGLGITIKETDVVASAESIVSEFNPIAEARNTTVTFNAPDGKIIAKTDASAFRNIVQSIVSNAVEYTPEGGSVNVQITKDADTFTISVTDTGIGIPKKEIPELFTKFKRAENAKKYKPGGTGLGLYIAKQATDILGGSISVKSEEGKGTTFTIILPIHSVEKKGDKGFV